MIKIINFISAKALRMLGLFFLKIKPSLRAKLNILNLKIVEANKQKIFIPNNLIRSVIVIEDKRYFQHYGIDIYSIFRALYKYITNQRLEGASTITQQLIRNLTEERKIKVSRKINELLLATIISNEFSKVELLHAYLNTYKFSGSTGICAFCINEKYDIENLSNYEAAEIAARFKYPSLNKSTHIKYLKRVRTIEKNYHQQISDKI